MCMAHESEKSEKSLMTFVNVFASSEQVALYCVSGMARNSESMSMSLRLYVAVPSSLCTTMSMVSLLLNLSMMGPFAPLSTMESDLKLSPKDTFCEHV